MAGGDLAQPRRVAGAVRHRQAAARREATAGRRLDKARHDPGDRREADFLPGPVEAVRRRSPDASYLFVINHTDEDVTIEAAGKRHQVSLPLIGAYQAANALTAAGLVIATGAEPEQTLGNLARVQPVRGRLERGVITRAGAQHHKHGACPGLF